MTAPNPHPFDNLHWPTSISNPLPNGLVHTSATDLGGGMVSWVGVALAHQTFLIWGVLVPFLVAFLVLAYLVSKIGLSMSAVDLGNDAEEETVLRLIRAGQAIPRGMGKL